MKARAKNKKSMLDFFDYREEYLNEREKIEGIDPLKILEMAEEELGRCEDIEDEEDERNGFELNVLEIDSNAIYRQPEIQAMHDPSQEDPRESEAALNDLSYVSLDGNIGCMVNGAGLAMGTMDTIKYFGGSPANFLDVGGTATQERVSKAFKLILADPEVKVVLVNIFGGIVRCDLIAEGILAAIEEVGVSIPVVVRLEGNNSDIGSNILAESSAEIVSLNSLEDAAKKAVELSK